MKNIFLTLIAGIALLLGLAQQARAEPLFSPPQLDQILAPIALYPDPLIAQILVAATYPLEIVEAARWAQEPGNPGLSGNALTSALELQDWDPSVKSLIPFPKILQMMNAQLSWTQQLGDAFLAQQADVMESIQRLRALALNAGYLRSTPQEQVGRDGPDITIAPADPQRVYVPAYNPLTAYGTWPYADYQPYYFSNSDWYADNGFGYSVIVVAPLWGWGNCDWRHRRIHVDSPRFNAINQAVGTTTRHPPLATPIWQHDSYHRRGVAYRDPATHEHFAPRMGGSPETRRAFRSYDVPRPPTQALPAVPPSAPLQLSPVTVPVPARPVTSPPVTRPVGEAPRIAPPQPVVTPRPAEHAVVPVPQVPEVRLPPPAFEHITPRHETHMESERGRESRQTFQPQGDRGQGAPSFNEQRRDAPNQGDQRSDRHPDESGRH